MSKKQTQAALLEAVETPLGAVSEEIAGDGAGESLPPIDQAQDPASRLQMSAPADLIEVRALMTDQTHGLVAGCVVSVPAAAVSSLKAAGLIDDHPEAVAYAKAQEA